MPGCGHLGAVSGDTGYPGVLCCTRLLDLGTVSWDTRGCCAVPEGKRRGPSSDHNPHSASVSPVLYMGWAPQGPWVPKEETWGSTRRTLEEQGAGVLVQRQRSQPLAVPGPPGPLCMRVPSHAQGGSPGLKDALPGEIEARGKEAVSQKGQLRPAALWSCVAGPGRVKGSSGPELSRFQRKPDMR